MLRRCVVFIKDVLSLNRFSSFVKGMRSTCEINSDCSVGIVFRVLFGFGVFYDDEQTFVSQSQNTELYSLSLSIS